MSNEKIEKAVLEAVEKVQSFKESLIQHSENPISPEDWKEKDFVEPFRIFTGALNRREEKEFSKQFEQATMEFAPFFEENGFELYAHKFENIVTFSIVQKKINRMLKKAFRVAVIFAILALASITWAHLGGRELAPIRYLIFYPTGIFLAILAVLVNLIRTSLVDYRLNPTTSFKFFKTEELASKVIQRLRDK